MDETLKSVLCRGNWRFDPTESALRFRETNTGYLRLSAGFTTLICSEFTWKDTTITPSVLPTAPTATVPQSTTEQNETTLHIGQISLEIRLTGYPPPHIDKSMLGSGSNRACLKEDAFLPKSFSVHIEEGSFAPHRPAAVRHEGPYDYSKRLIFDHSPLPPRSEWKEGSYGRAVVTADDHEHSTVWVGHFVSRPEYEEISISGIKSILAERERMGLQDPPDEEMSRELRAFRDKHGLPQPKKSTT